MRIDTVLKDMGLILGLGQASDTSLMAATGVRELYAHAQSAGFDAQDMAALFRFIHES
jgi:3-hydroxyisobutyrate dehydrogenase-like beta-hydroxyacid dehydrogenase